MAVVFGLCGELNSFRPFAQEKRLFLQKYRFQKNFLFQEGITDGQIYSIADADCRRIFVHRRIHDKQQLGFVYLSSPAGRALDPGQKC
jgi:hypothetical protein